MAAISGVPTTILVAPDSFKGTLRAGEIAAAIGAGLEAGGYPVDLCPVADGGEGTLEALMIGLDGELRGARVTDPLGRTIEAEFGLGVGAGGRTVAIVETAGPADFTWSPRPSAMPGAPARRAPAS